MEPNPPSDSPELVTFFKQEGRDMVRIVYDRETVKETVKERLAKMTDAAKYAWEWKAYQTRFPKRQGTPLTEIPDFNEHLTLMYEMAGVPTCEKLAELSDEHLQTLGLGTDAVNYRNLAQSVVRNKELERLEEAAQKQAAIEKVQQENLKVQEKIKRLMESGLDPDFLRSHIHELLAAHGIGRSMPFGPGRDYD